MKEFSGVSSPAHGPLHCRGIAASNIKQWPWAINHSDFDEDPYERCRPAPGTDAIGCHLEK